MLDIYITFLFIQSSDADADAENKNKPNMLTKWERKGKKVRWAKLVPVCWLIQGLLSATLRKYNITENSIFLFVRFFSGPKSYLCR